MIGDEVSHDYYVSWVECFRDTLIFGREDAPVFEGLHKGVDVVNLVSLSAREVDDDSLLVVVGVNDVRRIVISHYKGSICRGEIAGHPALVRVDHFVVVPEDLAWVNGIGDVLD